MNKNISLALKSETKEILDMLSFITKKTKTFILDNAVKNYLLDLQKTAKALNIEGLKPKDLEKMKQELIENTLREMQTALKKSKRKYNERTNTREDVVKYKTEMKNKNY